MRYQIVIGIVMILLGAVIVGYRQFSYRTTDKILDIGPIQATAEREHTIVVPSLIGWAFVGSGVCLLLLSRRSKS